MNKIIVFYGYKGCGKDTSFSILKKLSPKPFMKLSFAEKLRNIVWELFQDRIIKKERIWGTIEEKEAPIEGWVIPIQYGFPETYWSGRRLLQWFGTEICRTNHNEIWVNALIKEIHQNILAKNICITDCRFMNEYEALKKLKYKTEFIYIIKNNVGENAFSSHASEQDIKLFKPDHIINNDGTIKELEDKIEEII